MKTIRKGVFETNSSSTHTIVVPKKVDDENFSLSDSLHHEYEFGREECRLVYHWDEKLAYTYMVLKNFKEWKDGGRNIKVRASHINKFRNIINQMYKEIEEIVEYKPYDSDPRPNDIFNYIDSDGKKPLGNIEFIGWDRPYPYVDHCEDFDTNGFLERVLTDKEFVRKLIFNDKSYITVGGDEYRGYNIKTIGFEYDYDERYCVDKDGNRPPKEWFDERGCVKDEYWDEYYDRYNIYAGGFWDKLREYEKDNDVFLKGN